MGEPSLYPSDLLQITPPEYPVKRDRELLNTNRQLLTFWKTSPYHHKARGSRSGPEPHPDAVLKEITSWGGISPEYFPPELLLSGPIQGRGRQAVENSVIDRLKSLESREKTSVGGRPDRKGGEKKDADAAADEGDGENADDEEFGDGDYGEAYEDVEDGMGDDFEEADDNRGDEL